MRTLSLSCLPVFLLCTSSSSSAPPLQLHILPEDLAKERGAQCLDHTPAGYYIREQDPDKWVIFLEGGGLCIEPIDCIMRAKGHYGSSLYWEQETPPEGFSVTSTTDLNPFANFSHIYVPYCSGDLWLGGTKHGHAILGGLQMSGHLIVETLVDLLLNTTSIATATDVVLSGSSAGGVGTFHHVDWLADKLAARAASSGADAPRVTAFNIEGMFFVEKYPVLFPQFIVGNEKSHADFASKYLTAFFDPWYAPSCTEAAQAQNFSNATCFDVSTMIYYTKTPIFINMNRFDKLLIQDMGICLTCKLSDHPLSLGGRFTRFYGRLMTDTVEHVSAALPQHAWFVPSEFHHDENFYHFLSDVEKSIDGVSLRAAWESWYYDGKPVKLMQQTCDRNGPCSSAWSDALAEITV